MASRKCFQPIELANDRVGVGTKRTKPVDDEAAESRVGAVLQEGPDDVGLPHADHGHGRSRLPLGQPVLGILAKPSANRRALVELNPENRQDLLRLTLGDREKARKGSRIGIHEQIGKQVGIVRGIIDKDAGSQDVLGLRASAYRGKSR